MLRLTRRAFLSLGAALAPLIASSSPSRTRRDGLVHSAPRATDTAQTGDTKPLTTIARPWMGAITDTSIAFAADVESDGPGLVTMQISRDQHFRKIVSSTQTMAKLSERSATQNWQSINHVVNGLKPRTAYWARLLVDGRPSPDLLTFRTAPKRGVAAPYRFAVISCTNVHPTTNSKVHQAIAAFDPLFVVHTGDLQYSNISADDIALARSENTRRYRENADVKALLAKTPFFYVTDDHDTASNDCHWEKVFPSGATFEEIARNTRIAWRETTPLDPRMFPQISAGEIDPGRLMETQQFDVANTRHILLDTRSQNSRANATFLGNDSWAPYWNQLAWLKSALVQAGADEIDRIFLHVPIGWVNGGEVGRYFSIERTMISDHLRDEPGIPPVTIITGDFHLLAIDDGTHSDFSQGGGLATGVIMSSAAYQTTIPGTGPYSWLGESSEYVLGPRELAQFFTIIDVAASGEWTVRFYGDPYAGTKPTLLGTYSLFDTAPEIAFSGNTASAQPNSVAHLPLVRTWLSTAAPISVKWRTSDGQSGRATFRPNSRRAVIPVTAPADGLITVRLSSPLGARLGDQTILTLSVSN